MMNSKNQRIMNRKNFAVAALMLLMPLMMGAQTLKGSYFLDNSLNRNKLNPAFAPNSGYFQLPVIGSTSLGVLSNLDLQTFMYPMNGQLYTFLNKNVSVAEFDAALPSHPHLDLDTDVNLLSFGWSTKRNSFWTVDLGVRVNASMDMPRDLFIFMKKGTGTAGSTFDLGKLNVNAAASLQAALGYSMDLSSVVDGLRVGAKARLILPVAYLGAGFDDVTLTTGADKWKLDASGTVRTAMKGLSLMGSDNSIDPQFKYGGALSGMGMSFDLGAEYTLKFDGFINGVSLSAAVTDLGFISYSADAINNYGADGELEWTGFQLSMDEEAFSGAIDELEAAAQDFIKLKDLKDGAKMTTSSLPSFYVGAEMPFLNNTMSIGALYSARKSFNFTRNELTLSYNLNPVKWFALGLNYSFLNVTKTMGALVEFTPKVGPCILLGTDYMFTEMAKMPEDMFVPAIPTAWRFNFHFGLAFALGGKSNKDK